MTTPTPLRAVSAGELPTARELKSVMEAARGGSHRELLVSMRDRIAEAVTNPDCPPRDLASLTKRLQDIANEIEAIDARSNDGASRRMRELEAALRKADPANPLLVGAVNDRFDASAI